MDLRELFEKTLECKHLCTILQDKPLVERVSETFAKDYQQQRIQAQIPLRSLRKQLLVDSIHKHPAQLKEARQSNELPDYELVLTNKFVAKIHNNTIEFSEKKEDIEQAQAWFDQIWANGHHKL